MSAMTLIAFGAIVRHITLVVVDSYWSNPATRADFALIHVVFSTALCQRALKRAIFHGIR